MFAIIMRITDRDITSLNSQDIIKSTIGNQGTQLFTSNMIQVRHVYTITNRD